MSQAATKKKKRLGREELTLNLMILPGLVILIIFVFAPLVGSLMAFENYVPAKGLLKSKWVGLSNFDFIFSLPDSKQVFMNTLIIAFSKLVVNIFVPVTFAILLNEIRVNVCKKIFQTVVYLPHFFFYFETVMNQLQHEQYTGKGGIYQQLTLPISENILIDFETAPFCR